MTYVVMFDKFQDCDRPNECRVSASGSLDYCRRVRILPDRYDTWWRPDYSIFERVEGHDVDGLEGAIYRTEKRDGLMAAADRSHLLPVAAVAGGTFLMGLVVGAALRTPITGLLRGDGE